MILCHHQHQASTVPRDRRSLTHGRETQYYGSSMEGAIRRCHCCSEVYQGTRLRSVSCVATPNWFHRRVVSKTSQTGNPLAPLDYLL